MHALNPDLTRLALVGTANAPTDVASHPAVDNLIAPGLAREARLLAQAGASALVQSAGRLAQTVVLPPAAPPETTRELPAALAVWIDPQSAPAELDAIAPWMVQRMQQRQAHLPPALLPLVLADTRSRALWWPVLGQRGDWLAQLNPDWQTAAIPPDLSEAEPRQRLWDEGTLAQRCAALSAQRQADPALARDWLRAALPQEKAEPRLALVQTLATNLSLDDEPLLDSLLGDRSSSVRSAAAQLLARLPQSACAQRLAERADQCLRWQPAPADAPSEGGLLQSVGRWLGVGSAQPAPKMQWRIEPPAAIDKSWERDSIQLQPNHGEGQRAFWLRQLLALVPPARWTQQTQASPAQLLAQAQSSEWAEAVLLGMTQAASHFADSAWAEALLHLAYTGKNHGLRQHAPTLWAALDTPARLATLTARLHAGHLNNALEGLRTQPAPWPAALTEEVVNSASSRQWGLPSAQSDDSSVPERLDARVELLALAALHAADEDLRCIAPALRVCIQAISDALDGNESTRSYHHNWQLRQSAKQAEHIQTQLRAKQQFIQELPL